jgi:hypothetical protein
MTKNVWKGAWGVVVMLLAAQAVQAASVIRTDFGPTATEFDFTGALPGTATVTSGNLTVSGGWVAASWAWPGTTVPNYYDGEDSTPIRLDFSSPVSAVGMDFIANKVDTTLTLYDVTNTVLESYTVPAAGLPIYTMFPYGFIGIDYGSEAVSYAIIDTPLIGNELYIDNIIYEGGSTPPAPVTVPAPGAIALASIGAGLIGWLRRRASV